MLNEMREKYASVSNKSITNDASFLEFDRVGNELSDIKRSAKSKYANVDFDDPVESMQTGETWNSRVIGDIYVNSVDEKSITITSNGMKETYEKSELKKILSDTKGKISKFYDAEDTKTIKEKQNELSLTYSKMDSVRKETDRLKKELKKEIQEKSYDVHIVSSDKTGYIMNGRNRIETIIHEFDDGVVIHTPKNPKGPVYDVKQVYGVLSLLPDSLKNEVSRINILDEKSYDDKYWSEKLNKDFTSAGSAGDDDINLYTLENRKGFERELDTKIIIHEAAHNDDNKGYNYYSDGSEWGDAIKNDDKGYVSDYAKLHKNNREDYADSVEMFFNNNDLMKTSFPNRYAIIERHYNGGLPLNRESSLRSISSKVKKRKTK